MSSAQARACPLLTQGAPKLPYLGELPLPTPLAGGTQPKQMSQTSNPVTPAWARRGGPRCRPDAAAQDAGTATDLADVQVLGPGGEPAAGSEPVGPPTPARAVETRR